MAKVNLDINPIYQSGYTYLQSAGSDGSDRTVEGYQLRWDLLRTLGDHFAKGNYADGSDPVNANYQTTLGFNKANDFVKIYRADCTKLRYFTNLNFATSILNQEIQTGTTREWHYNNIAVTDINAAHNVKTNLVVRFMDTIAYDDIRKVLSGPLTFAHIDTLLKAYIGRIEIELQGNKLSFYVKFKIRSEANLDTSIRVETVSIPDTMDVAIKQVSSRKKYTPANTPDLLPTIIAENIQYVRYDYKYPPMEISFITYNDFILGVNKRGEGAWSDIGFPLGNFALTIDDAKKESRLMPNDIDGSGGHWPKYNNGDPERGDPNPDEGEFFVNKDRYNEKWEGFNGLKALIQNYLEKSKTDERAMMIFDADNQEDDTIQEMSILDLLRLISLDYHFARILGLGHIDKAPGTAANASFIYCLEYQTAIALEAPHNSAQVRTHLYLSLPTNKKNDSRLPTKPVLSDLTYGTTVKNGTDKPISLTDENGYIPNGKMRFINLNRRIMNYEKPFGDFYYETTEFNLSHETPPIGYGLEYRFLDNPNQNPRPPFHKVKISSDEDSRDKAGYPEIMTILEQGIGASTIAQLYTHLETEEGLHEYAAYSINWFSRTSALSDLKETLTTFPKVSRLLPPANFGVQLIQDEDPGVDDITEKVLLFTTEKEQEKLKEITSGDKTLVRINFDWSHIHNNAHQYADFAELFFRVNEPKVVKGKVLSVGDLGDDKAEIATTPYDITSAEKPYPKIIPEIDAVDTNKFKGSLFSAGDNNYQIESIKTPGLNPVIIVKKIKTTKAFADKNNQGKFISIEKYESPKVGDQFFIRENNTNPANWDLRHSRKVYLERFYTNSQITIRYKATSSRVTHFYINDVVLNGSGTNTETKIDVHEKILFKQTAGLYLEYRVKNKLLVVGTNSISVTGDQTKKFKSNAKVWVMGSAKSDGYYTIESSNFNSVDTIVDLVSANFPTPFAEYGVVESTVQLDGSAAIPEFSIHISEFSFIIPGNVKSEVDLANVEFKTNSDGSLTRYVVGGINDTVTIQQIFEKPPVPNPPLPTLLEPDPQFYVVKPTGYLQIYFDNYDLVKHPDKKVYWQGGTVRLKIKDALNATTPESDLIQPFNVNFIGDAISDQNNTTPHANLAIVIQDPGFDPQASIEDRYSLVYDFDSPTSVNANFHPSYKLYVKSDNGLDPVTENQIPEAGTHFDKNNILPNVALPNERSKQTLMSIRSVDVKNNLQSALSNTVALMAIKYNPPIPPKTPKGPLYATRPDYQGIATYTFDTELNDTASGRTPYSLVFYRSSEDRILNVLYSIETQKTIWSTLNALPNPRTKDDPELWEILFKGINEVTTEFPNGTPTFKEYIRNIDGVESKFTWLLPDNEHYVFPFEANHAPDAVFKPFAIIAPNNFQLNTDVTIYGKEYTPQQILKKAFLSVFLPLTEQPPIFSYLKKNSVQTSPEKVNPRDPSGKLRDPHNKIELPNGLFPMATILPQGLVPNIRVRFTDYTLDGASKSMYFYLAMEMSDQFKLSEPSIPPLGPVLLVNSMPAEKPQIRKVLTQLQNSITNKPTAVLFEINQYLPNDKISKVDLYRAYDEIDALTTRTMVKAKTFNFSNEVVDELLDDFSDLPFPAYGEKLYYRLVALREIEDVIDVMLLPQVDDIPPPVTTSLAPSVPSDVVFASVVDNINPQAPKLYSEESGLSTTNELKKVVLKWNATCYNGTYYLQKLNSSGNWVQIYTIKVKNEPMQYPPLLNGMPDFANYNVTEILARKDEDDNNIYHRFRVQVENSSGLFNLSEYEVTLAKGASDLQEIESLLGFNDGTGHSLPVLKSTDIITGASFPDLMTFTLLNKPLPAGHKTITSIEITITDNINMGDTIIFDPLQSPFIVDGIAAPNVDLATHNGNYTIKTKLFTDFAVNGAVQVFTLNYLAGPCYDLKQITSILKLTDATHDINPLVSNNINDGVAYPTFLKFTKIVDLTSINQTFSHIDIVVTDDLNNTTTKTLGTNDTELTFDIANSALMLGATNPNRSYEIRAKIFTNECAIGNELVYNISYTYTPCDDLTALTGIAAFTDDNGTILDPISNQVLSTATHPGGGIHVQHLDSQNLPTGHIFDHMDVILEDDLGGASIETIITSGNDATFSHGNGNLVLDNSNPGRTYFITIVLYTNLCSNGTSYVFTIKYA